MKAGQAKSAAAQASVNAQASTSFEIVQAASSDTYNVLPKALSLDNQTSTKIPATSAAASSTSKVLGSVINITA